MSLGVEIDKFLTWRFHITSVLKKGTSGIEPYVLQMISVTVSQTNFKVTKRKLRV